jgi:hypothetical protein
MKAAHVLRAVLVAAAHAARQGVDDDELHGYAGPRLDRLGRGDDARGIIAFGIIAPGRARG